MSAVEQVFAELERGTAFEFFVPGECTAWARAGGGKTMHRFTPTKQRNYMGIIKLYCQNSMPGLYPLEGPIRLEAQARYAWPGSWSKKKMANPRSKWKVSRPDVDNVCLKIVADALNGVAWIDDAQIAVAQVSKIYDERPGLFVRVEMIK